MITVFTELQYLERKPHLIRPSWFSCGSTIQVKLEFGNVDFSGGRKIGVPREKPSEWGQGPTKNSTHIRHQVGIKLEPHWKGPSPLTTTSSLLPLFVALSLLKKHQSKQWTLINCSCLSLKKVSMLSTQFCIRAFLSMIISSL